MCVCLVGVRAPVTASAEISLTFQSLCLPLFSILVSSPFFPPVHAGSIFRPPPTATAVFDVLVSPLNCYTHSILKKGTVGGGKGRVEMAVWEGFPENSRKVFAGFHLHLKTARPAGRFLQLGPVNL